MVATMGLYTFTVEATVPRLTVTEYVGGVISDSQPLFPIVNSQFNDHGARTR